VRRLGCVASPHPRACHPSCPVEVLDNFGNPYQGCPLYRLKTLAEIEAMTALPSPRAPADETPDNEPDNAPDNARQRPGR
jgi:hypothetical protein